MQYLYNVHQNSQGPVEFIQRTPQSYNRDWKLSQEIISLWSQSKIFSSAGKHLYSIIWNFVFPYVCYYS